MPIKETDTDIIFVEILKKETLNDLLHFDGDCKNLYQKFGIKDNQNQIAEALTKLISTNIKANILQYIEALVGVSNDGDNKDGGKK